MKWLTLILMALNGIFRKPLQPVELYLNKSFLKRARLPELLPDKYATN